MNVRGVDTSFLDPEDIDIAYEPGNPHAADRGPWTIRSRGELVYACCSQEDAEGIVKANVDLLREFVGGIRQTGRILEREFDEDDTAAERYWSHDIVVATKVVFSRHHSREDAEEFIAALGQAVTDWEAFENRAGDEYAPMLMVA